MNPRHLMTTKQRSAFTLIELLVVIAIIAILVGLLMAAVMAVRGVGPTAQNRHDVLQLQQALQKFKGEYGRYPPSQIRLRANLQHYTTKRLDALDDASISYLSFMFKSLAGATGVTNIQWAGPNAGSPNDFATLFPNGVVLEGDQCLVFFLGGPPGPLLNNLPTLLGGFTTDPADPVTSSVNRKKSMDFETTRLTLRVPGNPFPSYFDAYGKVPFVYFSSNNRPNGYATLWSNTLIYQVNDGVVYNVDGLYYRCIKANTSGTPPTNAANWAKVNLNSLGVDPYFSQISPLKYYNPDSGQLISAGADGKFGPGGLWAPATAMSVPVVGRDDVTNFYDKLMGIP